MSPSPVAQLVVAQPDGPDGWSQARPQVGVVTARAEQPIISVIVKATFSFKGLAAVAGDDPKPLRWSAHQLPLSLDEPSPLPDAHPRELYYPSDFAPRKAAADVMITGHAHAHEPASQMVCAVAAGALSRRFAVKAADAAPAISLCGASVVGEGEPCDATPGPLRCAGNDDPYHGEGFDYSAYQNAVEHQRADAIAPGDVVVLKGLVRGTEALKLQLPWLVPVVRTDALWWGERSLQMRCDTLWIDSDREQLVMVWRGDTEVVDDGAEINRLIVSLEDPRAPRDAKFIDSALLRGHFSYAVRVMDLLPGAAPIPQDDDRLRAAHRATMASPAPEPRLSLERYATIAATVAEDSSIEHRDAVLKQHGLAEMSWTTEERGWMERIANEALRGDARLANQYSEAFTKAQQSLMGEREMAMRFDEFVEIFVSIARTADTLGVLGDNKLTTAQWMRINRRMMEEMQRDKALADQFRDSLAQLEPTQPELPDSELFATPE